MRDLRSVKRSQGLVGRVKRVNFDDDVNLDVDVDSLTRGLQQMLFFSEHELHGFHSRYCITAVLFRQLTLARCLQQMLIFFEHELHGFHESAHCITAVLFKQLILTLTLTLTLTH